MCCFPALLFALGWLRKEDNEKVNLMVFVYPCLKERKMAFKMRSLFSLYLLHFFRQYVSHMYSVA